MRVRVLGGALCADKISGALIYVRFAYLPSNWSLTAHVSYLGADWLTNYSCRVEVVKERRLLLLLLLLFLSVE